MDIRDLDNTPYDKGEAYQLVKDLDSLSLEDQHSEIRSILESIGTDMELNGTNPYGNGDQSMIALQKDRDLARELVAIGRDIPTTGNYSAFSSFATDCMSGDLPVVRI